MTTVEKDCAIDCVATVEKDCAVDCVTNAEGDDDGNEDIVTALALGDAEATVVADDAPHCTGPSAAPP